ncbi:hypothetical protein J7E99_34920 [Streptomyces sp. ISL-44]|uniref:nSTAND1 domain-containing NTPase n=1 Tax=Streptomyces sp. ISL-44 TaxID=2819184 RepID=UPI001BE88C66|nr:helix-turn-helix domain-containing protein [Streptomyces sp. ISL-44]MBT2545737.1 hypothetical protein [Streptomyces sp. ISL-44]
MSGAGTWIPDINSWTFTTHHGCGTAQEGRPCHAPNAPLDLDTGPLTRFAADLRKLREAAGRPAYRALAKRAHYSSTTLSDAAGGHRFPSLGVTLAYVEACQGDRREWEARWHAVAAEIAASAQGDEPGETSRQSTPYAGLSAFQPEDADRFFGRERLTGEVLAKVRDRRFLAVFGPSGSGKSSLLRAGLVARARATGWPVMLFTPGPHPVEVRDPPGRGDGRDSRRADDRAAGRSGGAAPADPASRDRPLTGR